MDVNARLSDTTRIVARPTTTPRLARGVSLHLPARGNERCQACGVVRNSAVRCRHREAPTMIVVGWSLSLLIPPRGRQGEAERRLPARTGRRLALVQLITATERVHKSTSAGLFNTARSVWAHQMKSIQVNSFLAVIDLRRRRHLWCRRNRGRVRLNWRLSRLR